MTKIERARQALLDVEVNPGTEEIAVEEAWGRVLAERVTAGHDVPSFRRSAYDGYAVRREDIRAASEKAPVTLTVTETVGAGSAARYPVTAGRAARIMTGAMVPDGADAVVKHEDTRFTDREVRFFAPAGRGNLVEPGEDVKAGTCLLEPGKVMGAADAAMLAGQGRERVRVFRRPGAGLVSTGSELVRPGQTPGLGKIYDTNPLLLGGYLRRYGVVPKDFGIVPDQMDALEERIEEALSCSDMVITTGGVSVGDFDYIPQVMERIGARVLFHRLPFKPGGAMLAAVKNGRLILGLSGNPGAAAVGMLYVGLPFIRKLCGRSEVGTKEGEAVLKENFDKSGERLRILRGTARIEEGRLVFEQVRNQRNGAVSSMVDCDLLGEIPAGSRGLLKGERIKVYFV